MTTIREGKMAIVTSEEEYLRLLRSLVEQLDSLIQEIEESRKNRRYTESTIAMIEDSMSITIDLLYGIHADADWRVDRLSKLMTVLQTGRKGPNAYPVDMPAGKRKDTDK
jgi:hypothetical protein